MGARAYRHLSLYDPAPGSLIEIGSERGEGSTAWLNAYATRHGLEFHTCDIEPGAYERAREITPNAHLLPGVTVLRVLAGPVSVAHLDGFDWIPDGAGGEAWIADQRALYISLGYELNNERSQQEHLVEASLVAEKGTDRCVVICDDTWQTENGWDGKGGLAVPYLLSEGFEVADHAGCEEHSLGYTILRRR